MLDRKQLKYFIVSADVGSFSEAASVLYTTQSNVSKTIAGLEEEMGVQLFRREGRGVRLTPKGRRFYEGAGRLLAEFEQLEEESRADHPGVVRISATSGSWFARKFTEFYRLHEQEKISYNVHTDSLEQIIRRIRDMEDEIGFVYIFPDRWEQFQYERKRSRLHFEKIRELDGMLYFYPESDSGRDGDPENGDDLCEKIRNCRMIQNERDPFVQCRDWRMEDGTPLETSGLDVAVRTNSDYIMHDMLEQGGIANISAEAFTVYENGRLPGKRLIRKEGKIVFGILTNEDNPVSRIGGLFADYIRQQAEASPGS